MTDATTTPPAPPTVWQTLSKHVPDLRTGVAASVIVMVFKVLGMIEKNPALTQNQGFMFLAQAIVISGFIGSILAFLFAASKTSADKAKADANADQAAGGTVITTPPGPSTLTVETPPAPENKP